MKKHIVNFLQSGIGVVIVFTVIVFLSTWFYISYTRPKDIQYYYNGIKYQSGNLQSTEPISIKIKGKYSKGFLNGYDSFDGTIEVGDKIFRDIQLSFNKYRMSSLGLGKDYYGMIFIDGMFDKLTVEIHEQNQNGGYSWSLENGWLISAPCSDRKDAVEISNKLMKKLYQGSAIK